MRIKKSLKIVLLISLPLVVVITVASTYYTSVSRTFGITIAVKTSHIDSAVARISRASAICVTILPVTGSIEVCIPVNSFADDLSFTLAVKPVVPAVDRATVKLSAIGFSMSTIPVFQPRGDLTITIRYRDEDIVGLDKDKLAVSRYDDASGKWLVLRSTAYPSENKIVALTNHISTFALIQNVAALDLSAIRVYPNPWNPRTVPQGVVIDGLTKTAEIRIYSVTGELVTQLSETDGNGRIVWDGKNSEGSNVGNGIYIAVIKNGSEMKRTKIGIERK